MRHGNACHVLYSVYFYLSSIHAVAAAVALVSAKAAVVAVAASCGRSTSGMQQRRRQGC